MDTNANKEHQQTKKRLDLITELLTRLEDKKKEMIENPETYIANELSRVQKNIDQHRAILKELSKTNI